MFKRGIDIDDRDEGLPSAPIVEHDVIASALGIVCSGFGVLNSIELMGLAQESAREPARFSND